MYTFQNQKTFEDIQRFCLYQGVFHVLNHGDKIQWGFSGCSRRRNSGIRVSFDIVQAKM